jgi:hypothetical protein
MPNRDLVAGDGIVLEPLSGPDRLRVKADGLDGASAPAATVPIPDAAWFNIVEPGPLLRLLTFIGLRTWIRAIPLDLRAPTGADTPTQADNGRVVRVTSATAVNVTLSNLAAGTAITFTQAGAGKVTFVGDTGVTVSNRQGFTRTPGQHAIVTAIQVAANAWVISGDLESAT